MRLIVLASILVASLAAPVNAQLATGFVGVYVDPLGTIPCTTILPGASSTLYVFATLAGPALNGITGAEFRIEVSNPTGWVFTYTPPANASIVNGNPMDTNPTNPNDGSGVNLSFASCTQPATAAKLALGTISVTNVNGGPTNLLVKRHSSPRNRTFSCPLFVDCAAPTYEQWCMTASPPIPCSTLTPKASASTSDDPYIFIAALNGPIDPSGLPDPERPVEREVLTAFSPGIIQLPAGQTEASLAATTVNSGAIRAVLVNYGVQKIGKTFPNFTLADTLGTDRFGQPVRHANLSEHYTLTLPVGGNTSALAVALRVFREVGFADPDGGTGLDQTCQYGLPCPLLVQCCTNDPFFMSQQWPLVNAGQVGPSGAGACDEDIDADEAWSVTKGTSSQLIGIFDTGIDRQHQDMMGKVSGEQGYSIFHGTFVACIASANTNNGVGIAGVDWNARILAKILPNGDPANDPVLAQKIREASFEGADVLNNSWRLILPEGRYSHTVRLAFRDFYMDKRVAVASMGNQRQRGNVVQYPAAFGQGIITVGSTNRQSLDSDYSSTGPHIDVAAPGEDVWSCDLGNGYFSNSGTSFSAPHVSGLASLLLSFPKQLEPDDVEQIIRLSAEDRGPAGFDDRFGMGRINAKRAFNLLSAPNELRHDAEVGGTKLASDWQGEVFYAVPPPGVPSTRYFSKRFPVERTVTFPVTFQSTPKVWGRGSSTRGYSTDGSTSGRDNVNYGMGWCEPVGTIGLSSCTMRTYIYELLNVSGGHVAWVPTDAPNVVFAYSVLGEAEVTDVDERIETAARFSLRSQNPMRPGATLHLKLPKQANVRLEIFTIAGRRVSILHEGLLAAGEHDLAWQARSDSQALPAGLYFARVEADGKRLVRKIVLMP